MDATLIDKVQLLLVFGSIIIFSSVLLSSKTICMAYRPFVRYITIALILFAIGELDELFHIDILSIPLTVVAWIIILYALFVKLSSLTLKSDV